MSNNRYEVNPDLEEALMDLNDHMQKQLEKQEIDINDYDNVRYIVLKEAYENTIIFELYFKLMFMDLQYIRWNDMSRYLKIYRRCPIVSVIEQIVIEGLLDKARKHNIETATPNLDQFEDIIKELLKGLGK